MASIQTRIPEWTPSS